MKKKAATKKKPASRRGSARPKLAGGVKLGAIKRQLLAMRDDLVRTVRKQQLEDGRDTGDSVDEASQSIEKELLFELSDNERMTLDHIEAALRKIEKGTYGLCEACQKPIAAQRLKALPFARYCIACQSSSETSAVEFTEPIADFRGIEETGRAAERES